MRFIRNPRYVAGTALLFCLAITPWVSAQPGGGGGRGGRGFMGPNRIQLATLEKVQAALHLSDEHKKLAVEMSDKLSSDRRELFQGGGGGGDFAANMAKIQELEAAAIAKFYEKLDEGQRKRLTEIYVQATGASALLDKEVADGLKLTEEQRTGLTEARDKNRAARMEARQNAQGQSDDALQEMMAKLQREGDERLLAVLTEDQREAFGKMKGDAIELDLSQFRRGGGGRGPRPQ